MYRLALLAAFVVVTQLSERTLANPYGYYGAYSRTRRDPTAWDTGYGGRVQPNPIPMIPNAMGGIPAYGGRMDNQGIGGGGSYGQDPNLYGNQYGAMDRNSMMGGRQDSTSQHGAMGGHGGTDLNTYQQPQQQYPSHIGGASDSLGDPQTPDECRGVECQTLDNCIDIAENGTKCCPTCIKHVCICEGYQVYDCQNNGFSDLMVPEGKSYTVAKGTVCSCPPGGGSILCSFHDPSSSSCPDIQPNCVETFVRELDGCNECAVVGCVSETGTKVEAGMTMDKPPCSTCYCPPGGGEMICGVVKACEAKLKQQGTGVSAMESSIREINTQHSQEANAYGGYNGYGDYANQYGQNPSLGGGGAPVIPPVLPLGTGADIPQIGGGKNPGAGVGQGASSDSAGLNQYGSYQQQGYNTAYQGQYGQYDPYQGSLGYGGNYAGYGSNFGRHAGYSQEGAGYIQPSDGGEKTKTADASKDQSGEKSGAGVYQQPGGYGYQMGGFGQYGQQPYVPPLMSGYPSLPSQSADKDGSKPASESAKADLATSKSDRDSEVVPGSVGSQGQGYPYGGYNQGGYYNSDAFTQYNGYGQYQPQLPASKGVDSTQPKDGEAASDEFANAAGDTASAQHQASLQGYGGGFNQYPSSYDPYQYGTQYGYQQQQQQIPLNGVGTAGQQGGSNSNILPSDSSSSPVATESRQTQQGVTDMDSNGQGGAYQPNYPYYPYDQQPYPAYPSQSGSQYEPLSPTLMKPGDVSEVDSPVNSGHSNPQRETASGTRKIRDNLSVINKGRFSHEKTLTTTTSTPQTTTTVTTTTTPTTAATTTAKRAGNNEVTFETVLTRCCSRGRQWAVEQKNCGGISVRAGTYSQICSVAQEKCCLAAKEQQHCRGGMNMARSLAACDVPANIGNTCGANKFKTCCDCCEMGLKAAGLGLACDVKLFGESCNKAYVECCAGSKKKSPASPKVVPMTTATTEAPMTTLSPETPELTGPRCSTDSRCQQNCVDTSDGMICSCRRGFRLHSNKRDCVDVNECVINTHTCTEHQICLNREGSFFCQRRISCGTGYELTERNTCEDIDECALSIDDCLKNTDCDNIRGSYRCIPKLCDAGYITDATGRCIDIDECRSGDYTCPKGASCSNTKGGYDCKCPLGLGPNADNDLCEDIDECASGDAVCSEGATCTNTIGSFACREPPTLRCAPGYRPNKDTKTCEDIDECSTSTHTCKAGSTCINENGGFRCRDPLVCPEGLKPDEDGLICLDINECEDPSRHRCDVGGRCLNSAKTFKCVCDRGYVNAVAEDGLPTCKDVDECATSVGESCRYKCRNLPGSYECYCPDGYKVGNSELVCEDIDECAQRESPCAEEETCFNTQGNHKCVSLACPSGYSKISNTRCTRRTCRGKPRSCLKQPKQISFHNISLSNGTIKEKPLFRMSLARTHTNDRYEFSITNGNEDGAFKVKSSTKINRPTGVVYTAEKLVGPKDYIIDLSLKLNRNRRRSTFVSRLYIFVSEYSV